MGERVAAFLSNHLNKRARAFREALAKQTELKLVCNWLDLLYPYILEAEPLRLFLGSDGKKDKCIVT